MGQSKRRGRMRNLVTIGLVSSLPSLVATAVARGVAVVSVTARSVLAASILVLFATSPAMAAPPEAPETLKPTEPVSATTGTLHGVVNPKKEGEAGTYEFLYRASTTECEAGSKAPEPPGTALGFENEEVTQEVTGLSPDTVYAVCVVARNLKGEATVGPAVTFKTALPPETPLTEPATEITGTAATLEGVLNPTAKGDPGTYEFRVRASATECEGGEERHTPETPGTALGHENEVVSAMVTDLLPTTEYTFCLLARNEAGETALGPPVTFTTPASAPTIAEESVSNVGSTEARVSAQIDPGGIPTTFHVEYGTSVAYGSSTPEASVGAGKIAAGVQVELSGLQPSVEYHFRFIANSALGNVPSVDVPFTTSASGESSLILPDNRVYELVSSPTSNQNVYVQEEEGQGEGDFRAFRAIRASAGGGAVAYLADPPTGEEGEGAGLLGNGLGNAWLATRTPEGWRSQSIQPAGTGEGERGPGEHEHGKGEYVAFSADLSSAIIASEKPLAVNNATNCELYSRSNADGSFHPLATATQTSGQCDSASVTYAGSTPDESHQLFENRGALTVGALEASELQVNLYDSTAGQPHLVNVQPNGEPRADTTFGGPAFPALGTEEIRRGPEPDLSNVVSSDGSHIFWTALEAVENEHSETVEQPKALYTRINASQPSSPLGGSGECTIASDACTVQLDAGEPKCVSEGKCASGGGRFWTASRDGSKVFFTDCRKLTANATAVFNSGLGCAHEGGSSGEALLVGNDLYEYDFSSHTLTDLTVDHDVGDVLGADVQGVVAVNETGDPGSYLYFVAGGALAEGAVPRTCIAAETRIVTTEEELQAKNKEVHEEEQGQLPPGRGCNLYVLHTGEPIKFIAALSPKDDHLLANAKGEPERAAGDWRSALNFRMAEATPEGRHLLFRSYQPLTGYDSREPRPEGRALPEVFVYDASTGHTSCASCNPTGARPTEEQFPLGGYLPPSGRFAYTFMPRWISNDGSRVFFDTRDSLVPQDTSTRRPEEEGGGKNLTEGGQDVYEWEREGVLSCPERKSRPRLNGGCVSLLSGGTSTDDSFLIDVDATGENVFFASRASLVSEAVNENMKLYDARVGGGFPRSSLACSGTGCQGVPPAPPIFATPSTATFNGVGNFPPPTPPKPAKPLSAKQKLAKALKACRSKHNRRKRVGCEARARKRYGTRHKAAKSNRATKSGSKRRVKR